MVISQTYAGDLQSLRAPELQLVEQNITLGLNTVKVTYSYANTGDNDLTETLAFALPANTDHAYKAPNITVNQAPIQIQVIQKAISQQGYDVSRELKNLGLPFNPIAAIHSIDASANRDSIINRLRNLQILDQREDTPTWTVKTYFYWRQHFAAHSVTHIEHTYKPIVSSQTIKLHSLRQIIKLPLKAAKTVWNLAVHWTFEEKAVASTLKDQFEKYWPQIKSYNVKDSDYQNLLTNFQQKNRKKSDLEIKELDFAVATQDMWAHSINRFVINVEASNNMYPLASWQTNMQRLANNSLQFTADNFVPLQDIKILYIDCS